MKSITTYITEKLRLDNPGNYNYFPKTREELDDIIAKLIEERGNNADLNDIDVSKITDMRGLFAWRNDLLNFKYSIKYDFSKFNGNISNWDVYNVTTMKEMFVYSMFNGDISNWDVSNVTNMDSMFYQCFDFNQNISKWNVSEVENMNYMFDGCKSFNQDLSKWNVSKVTDRNWVFNNCPIEQKYKPKFK